MQEFDTQIFTPGQVSATINAPTITDTTLGVQNMLIPTGAAGDAWQISVQWAFTGTFLTPVVLVPGGFNVQAYLQPLDDGPNVPPLLSITGVTITPALPIAVANGTTTVVISVPANSVRAGLFNLTLAVTWEVGGSAAPMAAFTQGPILNFFTP